MYSDRSSFDSSSESSLSLFSFPTTHREGGRFDVGFREDGGGGIQINGRWDEGLKKGNIRYMGRVGSKLE